MPEGLGQHSWTQTSCESLIKGQRPIKIDSELSIDAACQILVDSGISSAPIFDAKTKSFVGMFDFRDLAAYLLLILQHDLPIPEDEKDTLQFRQIVDKAAHSGSVQVKLVADLSRRDPFYSVMPETTLLNVMDVFSKGIHRVAVIDADGTLKGVISQSAVVKFLRENMERFPEIIPKLSKTIKELKMESSPEIHVLASDTSVLKALRATVEHGLSSLPIVDHSGSLLASFSLSDLRYIMTTHKLNLLRRTCFDFAKYVDNQIGITTGRDRFPVFDVSPSSTLVKAVDKVVATKAHRVWVADSHQKPIGVVSLTDILRVLTPE